MKVIHVYAVIGSILLTVPLLSSCKTINNGGSSLLEGCYDPLPGHPTAAEKISFITQNAVYAQEVEKRFGVPAAGILAISAPESGYGFTKTGRLAKNPFGFKYNGKESSGNRPYYTLTCQPSWDKNNKYIKFNDFHEAFLFVGEKLATLKDIGGGKRNYKAHTDRYIADRKNGVDVKTAVNRWIDGIANAGYNYAPATYKPKIKSFASNMETGKGWSDKYNAYQYSMNIMPKSGMEPPKPPAPTTPPVQAGFDIEGVVHMMGDEDNRLANAYITFNGVVIATQETGYFVIENVKPGKYEFVARMEGFNDRTVSVTIVDQGIEVLVGLSPQ